VKFLSYPIKPIEYTLISFYLSTLQINLDSEKYYSNGLKFF